MKKKLLLILAVVLCLAMFTACSNSVKQQITEQPEQGLGEEQAGKQEEEDNAALLKFVEPLAEVMQTAAREQTYDFTSGPIADSEFRALVSELEAPVIFPLQDGRYLYIEPWFNFYCGQMKDDIREGEGIWYWATYTLDDDYAYDECFDIVVANWENNLPNGSAEMYSITNPESTNQENSMEPLRANWVLNLVDGVYEGGCERTLEYRDGSILHSYDVYDNGFLTESTYTITDSGGNTYEDTETYKPGETPRSVIPGLGIDRFGMNLSPEGQGADISDEMVND